MSRWYRAMMPALVILLALPPAAQSVIKNLTPLRSILTGQDMIFEAKVEKVDASKPAVWFTTGAALKGKVPVARMAINMTGDAEAKRGNHTEQILKRLAPGMDVILFADQKGPNFKAFAYVNGTWFQIKGDQTAPGEVRWAFLHGEPYLRRTFKGTTAEMRQAIVDGLAGKPVPPPDEKVPPGFGPEVEPKKEPDEKPPLTHAPTAGPLFAVAPTFLIIGPLALLAMLFPTTFGGLALVMKRWTVAMSVLCTASTIYFLHAIFAGRLQGTWLAPPAAIWFCMGILAAAGGLWSARRYRRALEEGEHELFLPRRWDGALLVLISILGLATVATVITLNKPLLRYPWLDLIAFSVPIWAATLAAIPSRDAKVPIISVETVFLWAMAFACANVVTLEIGRYSADGAIEVPPSSTRGPRPAGKLWEHTAPGDGTAYPAPLIDAGRVYVAAAQIKGLDKSGIVQALDASTGQVIWTFTNGDAELKPLFCSPVLADGRLYIGEGLHEDQDCKLYCLNATDGTKLWEFATTSHTESTPVVSGGKVYFGAGDDGIYCLDAANGQKLWNYPNVHIDSQPVVAGGRLYVGSGVGDIHRTTLLLCLDAATGQEVWKVPVDLPAFAPPTLDGDHVYFGIGNGNLLDSDENPQGAMLCVEAATGKRLWQADARDTVLTRPAIDGEHVYFGSRDGNIYCVHRHDGRPRWKRSLGGPIVASPVLIGDEGEFGTVRSLYVASISGRVACLDVNSGEPFWSIDLAKIARFPKAEVYAAPAVEVRGERRRIVIAAQLTNDQELSTLVRWYCFEDEVK